MFEWLCVNENEKKKNQQHMMQGLKLAWIYKHGCKKMIKKKKRKTIQNILPFSIKPFKV